MIAESAVAALPTSLPSFLRDPSTVADIGEMAREPDRWRVAGAAHDGHRDPDHYAYADDQGKLGGGPGFTALPTTRQAYDALLGKAGAAPDEVGFLPYAIIEGFQQVTKDFVYWRADRAGLRLERDPARRAWLEADRRRREAQMVYDIGVFAHFVGDATQPMHLSVHHDGWGNFPNPDGFTDQKVHIPYEGAYVAHVVTPERVRAAMSPARAIAAPVGLEVGAWLEASRFEARTWYALEKDGAFKPGDPRGVDYTTRRLGLAASELRDLLVAAWSASTAGQVNYPVATLADIESGKVNAWTVLHGPD